MTTDDFELSPETLSGDIRDVLLNYVRNLPKSWPELAEDEQRAAAQQVDEFSRALVSRVVSLVKADGQESAPAELVTFAVKGTKIKVSLEMAASDGNLLLLNHNRSGQMRLVSADDSAYQDAKAPVESHVQRDQPDMLNGEQPVTQQPEEPEDPMPEGDDELKGKQPPPLYQFDGPKMMKVYEKHGDDYWEGVKAFRDWDHETDTPPPPHDGRSNRGKIWQIGWGHGRREYEDALKSEEAAQTHYETAPPVEESQGGWDGAEAEAAKTPPPVPQTAADLTEAEADAEQAEEARADAAAEGRPDPTPEKADPALEAI